jgi:hypothetical protein
MSDLSKKIAGALAEISFIFFLFYTNLLMGQFTRSRYASSLLAAISEVFTPANALIGLVGATIGYFCIEEMRKRL